MDPTRQHQHQHRHQQAHHPYCKLLVHGTGYYVAWSFGWMSHDLSLFSQCYHIDHLQGFQPDWGGLDRRTLGIAVAGRQGWMMHHPNRFRYKRRLDGFGAAPDCFYAQQLVPASFQLEGTAGEMACNHQPAALRLIGTWLNNTIKAEPAGANSGPVDADVTCLLLVLRGWRGKASKPVLVPRTIIVVRGR